jgi:5-methylcytosine-specific restriction protein A
MSQNSEAPEFCDWIGVRCDGKAACGALECRLQLLPAAVSAAPEVRRERDEHREQLQTAGVRFLAPDIVAFLPWSARPGVAAAGSWFLKSMMPSKPPLHRPSGARSAAEVKRTFDRARPSATARGYGARWRRARQAFLTRHPLCVRCEAQGRREPATVVDHAVPHRGDPLLFWDEGNWAALCKRCHDAKTAREGRWG